MELWRQLISFTLVTTELPGRTQHTHPRNQNCIHFHNSEKYSTCYSRQPVIILQNTGSTLKLFANRQKSICSTGSFLLLPLLLSALLLPRSYGAETHGPRVTRPEKQQNDEFTRSRQGSRCNADQSSREISRERIRE